MVSIGKLATGQADYYLDQAGGRVSRSRSVASGAEDYYLGGAEADGEWTGAGSASLKLKGKVDDGRLRAVLEGRSPTDGDQLTRRPLRVPGFDVTFSAPKSVSVLFALGAAEVQEQARAAHDAAVQDALAYLERQAAFARRGHNGLKVVPGEGFVAAAFRHRTSRAGDPQLHTHVLVANLSRGPDGRWRALDGRRLYRHARTAGFLYEFRLRAELTRRLGIDWEQPRNGIADVLGIDPAILRAFSRRRAEIEAELERTGQRGAAAAQVAALETRRCKDRRVTPAELLPEWRQRAQRLGLRLEAHLHAPPRGITTADDERRSLAQRLAGHEGLTRDRSTFDRQDAVQAWCEQTSPGTDLSVAELEAEVDRMLGTASFVPLGPARPGDTEGRAFTTPELLEVEKAIVELAALPGGPVASSTAVQHAGGTRPTLSPEQLRMVERLTSESSRVAVVVGKAGSGKTFALDAARDAWQRSGVPVIGAAVARRAARELEEGSGILSTTLAALMMDLRRGGTYGLAPGTVVVVDEASLVPTRLLGELLAFVAAADGKVVLVGDHHQLPAIQAGGAFRALVDRLPAIHLTTNRRQDQAWEREALDLVREGDASAALATYAANDRLTVGEDAPAVRNALVTDWWRSAKGSGDAVMIALRRADVADLNARARARLRADGRLGDDDVVIGGVGFAIGDRVVLRRNDRRLGVANGDRADVVAAAPDGLVVELAGRRVRLDQGYLSSDRAAVTHGYAITGHVAQGMTVDAAFVLGTDGLFQEWGYVALSRGREENRFYAVAGGGRARDEFAPAEEQRDALTELAAALGRSRAELAAIDSGWEHGVASASTSDLETEALQLRRQGAGKALGLAKQLRRVEPDTPPHPNPPVEVEARLAEWRRDAIASEQRRLHAELHSADHAGSTRLALIDGELARRKRLAASAEILEPSPHCVARHGARPERPSELRRWCRRVVLDRARDAARAISSRVRG